MPVPRVFHPEPLRSGDSVRLTDSAATHVTRVLRLEPGARLRLFNGDGLDYAGTLARRGRQGVLVDVGAGRASGCEPSIRIELLQGICRGQRMDLVIQKATELGVTSIRALACERSVVRLDAERARRRQAHWHAVAVSAAEQCGRATVPETSGPMSLEMALEAPDPAGSRVLLDPEADADLGKALESGSPVVLLCGPEGGLTAAERDVALRAGFVAARVGPRILRTETAPMAAMAVIQYLLGDFGTPR